jgi:hypothetical protein
MPILPLASNAVTHRPLPAGSGAGIGSLRDEELTGTNRLMR